MKLRKVKHLIPKGRYCYEWVNVQTGEIRSCPFLQYIQEIDDENSSFYYDYRCKLIKEDIFDQVKMCGIKPNY